MVTDEPLAAEPVTDWLITVPFSTVELCWVVVLTVNPAAFRVDSALDCVCPTTLGTSTVASPLEMVSVMIAPLAAVPVAD